jgi:peptidyl-tRNA hydrolase
VEADDDPLVMYLVVRRRTTRPFAELANAAALASRRCAARYRDDERLHEGFDDWWRHSFRKVCLRAEPRDWEAVRDLDHERVGDVACLPPVRRSARDRVLVRMQTLNEEAGPLPPFDGDPEPGSLTLVVATDLGMSSGKMLAQIGHAALMADLDPDLDLNVVGAAAAEWRRLAREAVAIVRDGGLTELTPGSETVLVLESAHDKQSE